MAAETKMGRVTEQVHRTGGTGKNRKKEKEREIQSIGHAKNVADLCLAASICN